MASSVVLGNQPIADTTRFHALPHVRAGGNPHILQLRSSPRLGPTVCIIRHYHSPNSLSVHGGTSLTGSQPIHERTFDTVIRRVVPRRIRVFGCSTKHHEPLNTHSVALESLYVTLSAHRTSERILPVCRRFVIPMLIVVLCYTVVARRLANCSLISLPDTQEYCANPRPSLTFADLCVTMTTGPPCWCAGTGPAESVVRTGRWSPWQAGVRTYVYVQCDSSTNARNKHGSVRQHANVKRVVVAWIGLVRPARRPVW